MSTLKTESKVALFFWGLGSLPVVPAVGLAAAALVAVLNLLLEDLVAVAGAEALVRAATVLDPELDLVAVVEGVALVPCLTAAVVASAALAATPLPDLVQRGVVLVAPRLARPVALPLGELAAPRLLHGRAQGQAAGRGEESEELGELHVD